MSPVVHRVHFSPEDRLQLLTNDVTNGQVSFFLDLQETFIVMIIQSNLDIVVQVSC